MAAQLKVLLRDFWSRYRYYWLLVAFVYFIFMSPDSSLITFFFAAFISTMVIGGKLFNADGKQTRIPERLYLLPISTARLVALQFLVGLSAIVISFGAMYLVSFCLSIYCPSLAHPPLLESLLLLFALFCLEAAISWTIPVAVVIWTYFVVFYAVFWWFRHVSPAPVYWTPSFLNVIFLLGTIAAAWFGAVTGVSRERCGEPLELPNIILWGGLRARKGTTGETPVPRIPAGPFRSPLAAQFWLEWRQKGRAPSLAMFLIIEALIAAFLFFGRASAEILFKALIWQTYGGIGLFSLMIGSLIGSNQKGPGEMDAFRATRPLKDRSLAVTLLKLGCANVLLIWLAGVAILLVAMGVFALAGRGEIVRLAWLDWIAKSSTPGLGPWAYPLQLFVALLMGCGMLVLIGSLVMVVRNPKWYTYILMAYMALSLQLPHGYFSVGDWFAFPLAARALIGFLVVAGMAWALVAARGRQLIGPAQVWIYSGLAAACAVAGFMALRALIPSEDAIGTLCECGALALVPNAPVLGSLAIHQARHR